MPAGRAFNSASERSPHQRSKSSSASCRACKTARATAGTSVSVPRSHGSIEDIAPPPKPNSTNAENLTRHQPAEGAGRQQTIEESVDDFFCRHRPRLAFPDAIAQIPQTVGEKRDRPGNAKDSQIWSAGSNGESGEIGDKESDHQAKHEPLDQEFRHRRGPAGDYGHIPDWSQLLLF